jgi:hypothetical protein
LAEGAGNGQSLTKKTRLENKKQSLTKEAIRERRSLSKGYFAALRLICIGSDLSVALLAGQAGIGYAI